ncbi:HyaD/HybD family hydrogenase maturation endopeptidase [Brevibacillus sp. SYSU BS000544]|uniref:HyaD/HybD family hydrogenase maturation endopeptidase n=1 Tax=Brevibacillus sp. SYSU BS000544 TaxID=3416443 RepID=UPI003CE4E8D0
MMSAQPKTNNIIVLGIGNILFQDEGVGVHAIEAFRHKQANYPEVNIEDGGTEGMKLLPLIEETTHLIIVDAVAAQGEAGELICLEKEEIPYFPGARLSQHQQSFQELLFLADFRGHLPENIYFIGIVPGAIEWGTAMTPEALGAIPQVVEKIEDRLKKWGAAV